jgi:hypothetical protein
METKEKKVSGKSSFSTVLYVAASVVALLGAALLVINVYQYSNAVTQYVAQGYPVAEVIKQLLPNQLLPGIFQPVGIYGGTALILLGIGKVNKKVSNYLALLANTEVSSHDAAEIALGQDAVEETTEA